MLVKAVPFKVVKRRAPRLRPIWHDFNCADCGVQVREYSDPKVSLGLCGNCLGRRTGRLDQDRPAPPQVLSAADWWTMWAITYESKLHAGLIDRYGKELA